MKAICLGLFLLVASACGQANGTPTAAVSPTSNPTASAATSPVPSASAQPSPTSKPGMLFAVLEAKGTANWSTYNTIAIVGLDGYARAKTTFAPMPVPVVGCMAAIIPPSAHVAAGKVYFADASGVIRSLGIDGKVSTVTTFPMTSTQQMLSFAVSPDGGRVVGTIFTAPKNAFSCDVANAGVTFSFDAYSAVSGQPSHLVYHETSTSPPTVMALTGWDAAGPIGTYPTVWATQGGGPGSTLGVYVRVDAATVKPGAQLSDPSSCQVWDSIVSGAFVCMKEAVITSGGTPQQKVAQPVSVRSADGVELWHSTITGQNSPFGPFLAPDGQHLMICCNDLNLADSHEMLVGRSGSPVNLIKGFTPTGWLDATTMIGESNTNPLAQGPFSLGYVRSVSPTKFTSMGFTGKFVGTVRP
jgi:hypothetical protein